VCCEIFSAVLGSARSRYGPESTRSDPLADGYTHSQHRAPVASHYLGMTVTASRMRKIVLLIGDGFSMIHIPGFDCRTLREQSNLCVFLSTDTSAITCHLEIAGVIFLPEPLVHLILLLAVLSLEVFACAAFPCCAKKSCVQ
jgi:hypothetical protein